MGTTGGVLIGGNSGAMGGTAGVSLSSLIIPAYRIAGITKWVGVTPSDDAFREAIPEVNRMLAAWNSTGHLIYTTSISDPYPLNDGQKIYTIGPGGDFDGDRPLYIRGANILFPTSPVVRRPVAILDDDEWRHIRVQDVPGAPPYALYYDGGMDADGRGQIYLRFQPPAGYSLELYTWQGLKRDFTAKDDVAVFPDGYEDAIVQNLAVRLAALNPLIAHLAPEAPEAARRALRRLRGLNARAPKLINELCSGEESAGYSYGWLDGGIG